MIKKARRFISLFLSLLIILFSSDTYAFSDEDTINNTVSYDYFFNDLCEMVDEAESEGFGAMGFNDFSNRIVVKTDSNEKIHSMNAVDSVEGFNCWHFFQYETVSDTRAAIEYYESLPNVEYVELDESFKITAFNTNEETDDYPVFDIMPTLDDWGSVSTNASTVIQNMQSNKNLPVITVAVLDSGFDYSHPFFDSSRIIDSKVNSDDSSQDTNDRYGHGTFSAGIIYNNTTPNVEISVYKVLGDNGETKSKFKLIQTIMVAVNDGADIVNMSLGGPSDLLGYMLFSDVISYAKSKGVPVVAAAGNDGIEISKEVPASIPDAITVAAVNPTLNPSDFSNYGSCVDIAAPGRQINSTIPYRNNIAIKINSDIVYFDKHYYATAFGTSAAAPFVSAAAAILLTLNPELTVSNIETILKQSAHAPDNWNYNYGTGIVDFEKMLTMTQKAKKPKISLTKDGAIISAEPGTRVYYTTDRSVPNETESLLYNGTPINTSGVDVIKAIAYKDGILESDVTTFSLRWTENLTVPYKGRYKLKLPSDIVKFTNSNEEIISFNGERITGNTLGESRLTVYLETGQKVTCNITVDFAEWQIVHKFFYKLFGVILWCFEFNC